MWPAWRIGLAVLMLGALLPDAKRGNLACPADLSAALFVAHFTALIGASEPLSEAELLFQRFSYMSSPPTHVCST
jgi:hypothetical protein